MCPDKIIYPFTIDDSNKLYFIIVKIKVFKFYNLLNNINIKNNPNKFTRMVEICDLFNIKNDVNYIFIISINFSR